MYCIIRQSETPMLLQFLHDTTGIPDRLLLDYTPDPVTRRREMMEKLQELQDVIRGCIG